MRLHLSVILIALLSIHGLSAIAYGKDQKKQTHLEIAGTAALKSDVKDLKHTIITPHLKQAIPKDTNVLWCNTFQLAWNELCDLAGGPIKMENAPAMVSILNRRDASKKDLDEKAILLWLACETKGFTRESRSN